MSKFWLTTLRASRPALLPHLPPGRKGSTLRRLNNKKEGSWAPGRLCAAGSLPWPWTVCFVIIIEDRNKLLNNFFLE